MKTRQYHAITATLTLVGAVVGAGFATGREIWEFFCCHPERWIQGVCLNALVFLAGIMILMKISSRVDARHYADLLKAIWGPRWALSADLTAALTLYAGLVVVLAGTGEILLQMTPLEGPQTAVAAGALLAALAAGERGRLMAIQTLLVPLLLALFAGIILSTSSGSVPGAIRGPDPTRPWWLSAALYAGLNTLLASAVIPALVSRSTNPARVNQIALLATAILGLTTYALAARIAVLVPTAHAVPLPLQVVAASAGPIWAGLYVLALLLALVTTGTACLYGLTSRYAVAEAHLTSTAIVVSALPWAHMGLIAVVGSLYALVGWLGVITILRAVLRLLEP